MFSQKDRIKVYTFSNIITDTFTDDKFSDWQKLKAFADNKSKFQQTIKICLEPFTTQSQLLTHLEKRAFENIVG